jgi:hypothetical protein
MASNLGEIEEIVQQICQDDNLSFTVIEKLR